MTIHGTEILNCYNNLVRKKCYSTSGSGTYYSYGITAAYNGDGYDTFYTFKSPSQTE